MLGRSPLELGLTPLEKECCQVGAETSKGETETGSEKAEPQNKLLLLGCGAIAGREISASVLLPSLFSLVHPVGGNQETPCRVSASTSEERWIQT